MNRKEKDYYFSAAYFIGGSFTLLIMRGVDWAFNVDKGSNDLLVAAGLFVVSIYYTYKYATAIE